MFNKTFYINKNATGTDDILLDNNHFAIYSDTLLYLLTGIAFVKKKPFCLKNGKPIKNEQLGYECNVFNLFIHDATKAFVIAEFKLKIGVILPVTEEQFIEANKNIKDIVNTDTAIINCGAYGKGRIYHLEYTKLADSERGRL